MGSSLEAADGVKILDSQLKTGRACDSTIPRPLPGSGIPQGPPNQSARVYCTLVSVSGRQVGTDLQHTLHSVEPRCAVPIVLLCFRKYTFFSLKKICIV